MTIRRSDIVFFFAMLVGLYVAWLIRDVLLLIYVSALFAVVLAPAVETVQRLRIGSWRPSRSVAILIIIAGGVGLLALFFGIALPPIFRDLRALAADWPRRSTQLADRVRELPGMNQFSISGLTRPFAGAAGSVLEMFRQLATALFWFFSWLILTVYFIAGGKRAFSWLLSFFPPNQRQRLEPTLYRAEARVRNWLIGQGVLMLILGCASVVVFGLLRVKYFFVLAVFAGLANIVPIVGPLASFALASLAAGFDSWEKLVGVLIFYFVYAQVEHAYLTPRIMRTTLDLPPLAVIIALSAGGVLAGVLGALIALPTAALVAVLADEYLVKPQRAASAAASADKS